MKAAVISLGSESSKWTHKALEKYFDEVREIDLRELSINLGAKEPEVRYKGKPLEHYDCIYAKGSFRYADLLRSVTTILEKKCFMPI